MLPRDDDFIDRFLERRQELLDLSDNFHDLEHFYDNQKTTWDKLRKAYDRFQLNRTELELDAQAAPALRRIQEILQAPSPYSILKEADGLIGKVEGINGALVSQQRTAAQAEIDKHIAQVRKELAKAEADEIGRASCRERV